MKHLKFPFHTLFMAMMCVVMMSAFSSCKSDDDDDLSLSSTLIGTWYEFTGGVDEYGYNDDNYYIFKADGTGIWYDSPDDYKEEKYGDDFKWSVEGDVLTLVSTSTSEAGITQTWTEKYRATSISSKKINWRLYTNDSQYADGSDEYGYYYTTSWDKK